MEAKDVIKWSVMGFLTLFFLSGLSLIIFGITIPTPFGDYLTMKGVAIPVNYELRIAILFLLLIMTASHFFAITKENHRLLTLLGVLLIILFMVEFILAIIYFTMASEVNLTKKKLTNGMQMLAEYGVDEKVTQAFDQIQRTYACCGILDYRDWFTSKWAAAQVCNCPLCNIIVNACNSMSMYSRNWPGYKWSKEVNCCSVLIFRIGPQSTSPSNGWERSTSRGQSPIYSVLSYGRLQSFISDIFLKIKFSISMY